MLRPVSEGGATDVLLDSRPIRQVSSITISFLCDSSSEKRIERREESQTR